ncbi:MAG: phytoene/squalene synthase family protein [Candidatus Margulisiibacteriota bacterium]|jgi:phytoene synthase
MKHLRQDLEYCRELHRQNGKSYYCASAFFPRAKRSATYAIYALLQTADKIVNDPDLSAEQKTKKALEKYHKEWQLAYETGHSRYPVLNAASYVFHHYKIPYEHSEAFFKSMFLDLSKKRYENYLELKEYLYGSAAVIGLMMAQVIGYKDAKVLHHAEELGCAMQLTNILRRIAKDLEQRDRIYLPLEELQKFGVTENDLQKKKMNANIKALMKFQADRARALYADALPGIDLLAKDGRFAVKTAVILYSSILDKIERDRYNVLQRRTGTNFLEKIFLVIKLCFTDLPDYRLQTEPANN